MYDYSLFHVFQALDAKQNLGEDSDVCKVMSELHFIKGVMYHTFQSTANVVILLDGVKEEEVPAVFRDRVFCKFPKEFNNKDDEATQLIGLLLGEEPIQVVGNIV